MVYQLGPVIGKLGGGAETIIEPFFITADNQSVEYILEVADGEEWIFVAQFTITKADGVFANQLGVFLDGVELRRRLGTGDYLEGETVTSTARIEVSGVRTNEAHGRFVALKVSD